MWPSGSASIGLPPVSCFNPCRSSFGYETQASTNGVVSALGALIAAAGLWVFGSLLHVSSLNLMVVVLIVELAWITVALQLGRTYRSVLLSALLKRKLGAGATIPLDTAMASMLEQSLRSAYPEVVVYALHTLAAIGPETVAPVLPTLLELTRLRCASKACDASSARTSLRWCRMWNG